MVEGATEGHSHLTPLLSLFLDSVTRGCYHESLEACCVFSYDWLEKT